MNSPWREPMVWLVVALPAASVVASLGVVVALGQAGAADSVPEQVQRISQIQLTDLSPDETAGRLGLTALLRFAGDGVELRPVAGELPAGETLELLLAHPTDAALDRRLRLQPGDGLWRCAGSIPATHDWNLYLSAADGRWRLTGRMRRNEQSALLSPGLAAQ